MLFEAIPLLFFYLFTSVFSGAKYSIAAVSSGLPPLFHSMEFLLPAFLRTADPGLLFFQENSFCTSSSTGFTVFTAKTLPSSDFFIRIFPFIIPCSGHVARHR